MWRGKSSVQVTPKEKTKIKKKTLRGKQVPAHYIWKGFFQEMKVSSKDSSKKWNGLTCKEGNFAFLRELSGQSVTSDSKDTPHSGSQHTVCSSPADLIDVDDSQKQPSLGGLICPRQFSKCAWSSRCGRREWWQRGQERSCRVASGPPTWPWVVQADRRRCLYITAQWLLCACVTLTHILPAPSRRITPISLFTIVQYSAHAGSPGL